MLESVSIIIPIYNPERGWEKNVVENISYVKEKLKLKYALEIILVNDGTSFNISKEMQEVADKFINTKLISNTVNKGKGYTIRRGLEETEAKYNIYTDSDFPYENSHILEHIEKLENGDDIVITIRNKSYYDSIPIQRKAISLLAQKVIKILFKLPTADTQGGLKSMNKLGKELMKQTKINGYLFDLEFLKNAMQHKQKIGYVNGTLKKHIKVSKMPLKVLFKELINLIRIF